MAGGVRTGGTSPAATLRRRLRGALATTGLARGFGGVFAFFLVTMLSPSFDAKELFHA
jgi:hypothetical protein